LNDVYVGLFAGHRVIILRHVSRSRRPKEQPPRNSSPRSCSRTRSTAD
jgi:hypothetical protein